MRKVVRQRDMRLIAAAILATAAASLRAQNPPGPPPSCTPADTVYFTNRALRSRASWYRNHLRAMEEPRLCPGRRVEAYRFLWLRTYDEPVAVRVDREGTRYRLTLKELSGQGGYAPGTLRQSSKRWLTAAEAAEVHRHLARIGFWALSTRRPADDYGEDGAHWILEGTRNGRYHVVDRWTPGARASGRGYRDACLFLLRLAGYTVDSASVY